MADVEDGDAAAVAVEEMSVSKLDYHLQEYSELLAKARVPEKGQVIFFSLVFAFWFGVYWKLPLSFHLRKIEK